MSTLGLDFDDAYPCSDYILGAIPMIGECPFPSTPSEKPPKTSAVSKAIAQIKKKKKKPRPYRTIRDEWIALGRSPEALRLFGYSRRRRRHLIAQYRKSITKRYWKREVRYPSRSRAAKKRPRSRNGQFIRPVKKGKGLK